MSNSATRSTLTVLCNHHLYLVPEGFHHRRKPYTPFKKMLTKREDICLVASLLLYGINQDDIVKQLNFNKKNFYNS